VRVVCCAIHKYGFRLSVLSVKMTAGAEIVDRENREGTRREQSVSNQYKSIASSHVSRVDISTGTDTQGCSERVKRYGARGVMLNT